MNILNLIDSISFRWIVLLLTLVLLIVAKKYFVVDTSNSKPVRKKLLITYILLFGLLPLLLVASSVYKMYFPDYRYEEMTEQASIYLYQPTYLPPGVQQETSFYLADYPLIEGAITVRTVYNGEFDYQKSGDTSSKIGPIVINQSALSPTFELSSVVEEFRETNPENSTVTPMENVSIPKATGVITSNDFVTSIWIQTETSLVQIISPNQRTPMEEMTKIAQSLE